MSPLHFSIGSGFFIFSCMSYVYILDNNSLSVISFINISSHSVDYLFVNGFLCCAKAFKSHLCIFVSFALGERFEKAIAIIYVKECSMFSPKDTMFSNKFSAPFSRFSFWDPYSVNVSMFDVCLRSLLNCPYFFLFFFLCFPPTTLLPAR